MALTIISASSGVGAAAKTRAYAGGNRPVTTRLYSLAFDNDYPTGGESIASIFADFTEVLFVGIEPMGSRLFEIDHTLQTILVYTAVGTEASNNSDQSSLTAVRLRVVGY